MPLELQFTFPLENGFHARPASIFRDAASRFTSSIFLTNRQNNAKANAKSTLALISTLTKHGDACTLSIEGEDQRVALDELQRFINDEFPLSDVEPPQAAVEQRAGNLPRWLKVEEGMTYRGTAASRGIALSRAYVVNSVSELPDVSHHPTKTVAEELAQVEKALHLVEENLRRQLAATDNKTQQDIIKAHLSILEDSEFNTRIGESVRSTGRSAGVAITDSVKHFAGILRQSGSLYLQERILDIRDIGIQLLEAIYGRMQPDDHPRLTADAVWVTGVMTPSQFIALDKRHLKGIVMSHGGTTSHTVILARAYGIPCLTGVEEINNKLSTGQEIIVDGERGFIIPDPADSVREFYTREIKKIEGIRKRLARFAGTAGTTADGKRLEIAANVGSLEEAKLAFRNGAEAIGLFRTELLFMNRLFPPSEEEQFVIYSETARIAGDRRVIIRTLDVGGDKPIPYLNLPAEKNPFLGYRAVRMYDAHKELIDAQLKAILRASAFGNIKIMFPMISSLEEVRKLKQWIKRLMQDFDRQTIAYNRQIEIGIMVEIPSVALVIDQLSKEVDFFSIGSNDLAQYFFAVDRENQNVSHLSNSFHPSFLRLIKKIIDDAHAQKKWVGICGRFGGERLAVPLFVGYGIDEISLASPDIPTVKSVLSEFKSTACGPLLDSVLSQESPEEVESLLKSFSGNRAQRPLIAAETVKLQSESKTIDEAIRELIDLLHLAGRVENADTVEEAVWAREETYSTGVGFEVAIPHCKSNAVLVNSISILRTTTPIPWKSLDDKPVKLVIMIVIKADAPGDEHLRMIARLSRKLMDEKFRDRLFNASKVPTLVSLIESAISA
jgi:phosphoenolpyruvate-protein phosphotransferase